MRDFFQTTSQKILPSSHKPIKIGIFSFLVLAVLAALFGGRFVHADTVNFYPASCLGNWQNVENALGKPDLPDGADSGEFNASNSAMYVGGDAEIFCGNFAGEDPGNRIFQKATVHFSWTLVLPPEQASISGAGVASSSSGTVLSMPAGGGGGAMASPGSVAPAPVLPSAGVATISSFITETTSTATTAAAAADTGTSTDSSTVTLSVTDSSTTPPSNIASSSVDAGTTATQATDTVDSAATPSSPTATDTDAQATGTQSSSPAATNDTEVQNVASDTPPVFPPPAPPTPADTSTPSSTSFLSRFVPVAFADSLINGLGDEASSQIASAEGSSASSSSSTVSSSLNIPFDPANPASSSSVPVTQMSSNDVFQINYSLDGKTWMTLGTVDTNNWQNVFYNIPINSWSELAELQISVKGLLNGAVQSVFLDGITVTAEYENPEALPAELAQPKTLPSPTPVVKEQVIFDPKAKQACSVDPFSISAKIGGTADFNVALVPSATPHPAFTVRIGDLPYGVTGAIVPSSTNQLAPMIHLSIGQIALVGSYGIIFMYEERESDGTKLPNYCQFNLVIQ
jgi:hypothetical protein